jgi:8-oxo-dGTP pyrophosphatase MutT (NUDIX family)
MDKKGETPLETVKREIWEEIGVNPSNIKNIQEVGVTNNGHHIMVGFVNTEFKIPNLKKDENDDYGWFNENNLPSPMHQKWPETFQYVKNFLNLKEEIRKIKKLINV